MRMLSLALLASTPAYAQDADDTAGDADANLSDASPDAGSDDTKEDPKEEPPSDVPTLELKGTTKGSVEVGDGDYVVLTGEVTKDVFVTGGRLVIKGGEVGRDLVVSGGEVELIDAVIGRDLEGSGGAYDVGELEVGRDLRIFVAKLDYSTTSETLQEVFRHVIIDSGTDISINGDVVSGQDVQLSSGGDTTIDGTLEAGHDISVTAGDRLVVSGSSSTTGGVWGRNIDLSAGTTMEVEGSVSSTQDVWLSVGTPGNGLDSPDELSQFDVILLGDVSAGGDTSVESWDGAIALKGALEAGRDLDLYTAGGGLLGGTMTAGSGIVYGSESPFNLEATLAWGHDYSETNDSGEEQACGQYSYEPTSPTPKVEFWKCL